MSNQIKELLYSGDYSCIICNQNKLIKLKHKGVSAIYNLYISNPDSFKNAQVAEKNIGKGLASIFVIGGVKEIFVDVISVPALQMLENANIIVEYNRVVPFVRNWKNTGICPLEDACRNKYSLSSVFGVVKDFVFKVKEGKKVASVLLACMLGSVAVKAEVVQKDTTYTKNVLNINEVVVTGARNEIDIRHLPATVSVVNKKDIERRSQVSLLPLLSEQVPNFFVTSRGVMGYGVSTGAAGGMSLRGIGGSSLLVLVDGHPQYMGLFGHSIADSYQSLLAEKVEVLRGPASVLYGSNAMGGVVNIVTKKISEDGVRSNIKLGAGSFGTIQTEANNSIRKGKFSSFVSASYNRTDGHRDNMEFEQFGGYAKVGYEFNNNWNLLGDVNITHFNASNPGEVTIPIFDNDSKITRGISSLYLSNNYNNTSGRINLYYNWGRHYINDGYFNGEEPQKSHFNSKDYMFGVSAYQNVSFFKGSRITFGVDYMKFGGEAWMKNVANGEKGAVYKTPQGDISEYQVAGYVDISQNFGDLVSLNAGIRIDNHSVTKVEIVPQVGVAFNVSKNIDLKAMIGKGYRNPTIKDMYMFPPANPELKPERLMNYEVSFSHKMLSDRLRYGVNVFYLKGENIITTIFANGRPQNGNSGKIENYGVEVLANYSFNENWRVSSNYSWLDMRYPVLGAPEHKLYISGSFEKGRWSLLQGVQYVNGLYISNKEKENFVLWSLNCAFRVSKSLRVYLNGENLLGVGYEINKGYPMPKAVFMAGIHLNF